MSFSASKNPVTHKGTMKDNHPELGGGARGGSNLAESWGEGTMKEKIT